MAPKDFSVFGACHVLIKEVDVANPIGTEAAPSRHFRRVLDRGFAGIGKKFLLFATSVRLASVPQLHEKDRLIIKDSLAPIPWSLPDQRFEDFFALCTNGR